MDHRDLLIAIRGLVQAYGRLNAAIVEALPPGLATVAAIDPLTRVTFEEFGHPLVRWLPAGAGVRGVRTRDGVLVLDVPVGGEGPVLFLPGADGEEALHDDWRDRARLVGAVRADELHLFEAEPQR